MHIHFGNLVINIDGKEKMFSENFIKSAVKKHQPIEHHHTRVVEVHDKARESVCPSCLGVIITVANEYPLHCVWCGQEIDWSNLIINAHDIERLDLDINWGALTEKEQLALHQLLSKAHQGFSNNKTRDINGR